MKAAHKLLVIALMGLPIFAQAANWIGLPAKSGNGQWKVITHADKDSVVRQGEISTIKVKFHKDEFAFPTMDIEVDCKSMMIDGKAVSQNDKDWIAAGKMACKKPWEFWK